MSQSTLATLSAILAWVALIAYAVLGGADFGGGIWDLLARGPTALRERAAIARGMGPVWESNNVWLIFVLVVTWTAFPIVFAGVSTALFIPITLALIGIVLRGAAFSFRSNYGLQVGSGVRWGHVFNIASTITPFLFGTMAGALASGGIRVSGQPPQVQANPWTIWTTPFALSCGAFALGLCSVLSATYLAVEAYNDGDQDLAQGFRQRAIMAGAVTAVFGAIAAILASVQAPVLWHGLIGRALPLSLGAVLLGLATAAALLRSLYHVARVLVVALTVCILAAWAIAQWPYLIVPDVTIDNAASPASVLGPMVIVAVLGLAVLLPALWYLFRVFKAGPRTHGPEATVVSFVSTIEPPSASPPIPGSTATPLSAGDGGSSGVTAAAAPVGRAESALSFIAFVVLAVVITETVSRLGALVSSSGRERLERLRRQPRLPANAG
ncbi:MAG TPA: cytochrome d ubiquinol oxidase subunit II [Ktedonobacterales bacterium]|jgi:cytochrome d ubiquinol oxidase subunit II|nr:cytochrome d ubiquinol oxidase subunit II [Ktedonobacterales bacterium]